ncbi:hypothetical protein U14_03782 [Candidatus Moduliflexus flocculans]|uniref:Uncharacterized protein n=1 Tax=Candidatus Moduliflexus flocculans TaxID=1499966 RepID=A0A081BQ65_9BACT|nr:hypothetical protein U14_03782 [Candidatus Moduliflexus flocculans]
MKIKNLIRQLYMERQALAWGKQESVPSDTRLKPGVPFHVPNYFFNNHQALTEFIAPIKRKSRERPLGVLMALKTQKP